MVKFILSIHYINILIYQILKKVEDVFFILRMLFFKKIIA